MVEARKIGDMPGITFDIIGIRFVRMAVSTKPPEGTVANVDAGTLETTGNYHGARFKNGEWCKLGGAPLPVVPTYWTVAVEDLKGAQDAG